MDETIPTKPAQAVTRLGSYRLVEPLGSGGMSSVFLAVHIESGYQVALKVLPRYLAKNPTLLQRFLREAQNAEALEHPNIVSIYDRGSESGRHYLVLEYVDGSDLHDRVRNRGPMPVDEAIRVVKEAARGLQYASSKGVTHRDIKPANILMATDGSVKLIDLGLALQNEAEDERVTRHGTTVGTVDYMAPEQARDSRAANERSDMYSLGCSLYYLLTGFPPFPGGHIADKLRRHATQPPPDVRQLRPDVPRAVAKLIQRLMAKRPEDRFASYEALLSELDALELEPAEETSGSFEYALIVDDEESADFDLGDGASFFEPPSTRELPPVPGSGRLPATPALVDPASAGGPPASPLRDRAPAPASPARQASAPPEPSPDEPELRLSELAPLLDDEEEETPRRPRPSSPTPTSTRDTPPEPLRRSRSSRAATVAFDPFADLGEGPSQVAAVALGRRRGYGEEASVRAWAIGGALIGLVIALLGFAIISLIRMDWSGGASDVEDPTGQVAAPVGPDSSIERGGLPRARSWPEALA